MENNITPDYLRLSVTDLCNLNCIYCTPLKRREFLSHDQVLRFEEIVMLIKIFVNAGIKKVRLTGGEPLIKRNVVELVRLLRPLIGLDELSMTTNGVLLAQQALLLKQSGLDRINISLDTLKPQRFKQITGMDCFYDVFQGMEEAIRIKLDPVKLNIVPMRGVNDDEAVDFAKLTFKYPLDVRFVEFFHTNKRSKKLNVTLVPSEETKLKIILRLGKLEPVSELQGNGPAQYYRLKGAKGSIGFISGSTGNFCHNCNRIRVDCAGRISPCLFSGSIYDARDVLRNGADENKLFSDIQNIMKDKSCHTKNNIKEPQIEMSSLGG